MLLVFCQQDTLVWELENGIKVETIFLFFWQQQIYIYMDGSKHEMIPYQPSMFVQQGSCDKHPVVFQPRKQQEFLAVLD